MNRKPNPESTVPQPADSIRQIARTVQESLVPQRPPVVDGLAMASLFFPGNGSGSDYFEIIPLSEEKLAFLMFTVKGDPVAAAFIGLFARIRFVENLSALNSPSAVIERVYADITRKIANEFTLAAFVGNLDLAEGALSWCNAGLPGALVCRKDTGSCVPLDSQPVLDGSYDPEALREKTVHLSPGDWLFLHSAGLKSLCGDYDGESAPFLRSVKESSGGTPDRFIESVRNRCGDFEREGEDLSLIACEVLTRLRSNQVNGLLGFEPDAPVHCSSLNCFEQMDGAVGMVLKAMDRFGYPDEVIRKMKVAIIELAANAIVHGNNKDPDKQVVMGFIVDVKKAVISIMDEGEGFRPESVPDPTLPENIGKDCGRGLFLVRHFVDRLDFNAAGNRVTITKFHSVE